MQDNIIKMSGLSTDLTFEEAKAENKKVAEWQSKVNSYFDAISQIKDPIEKNKKMEELVKSKMIENMTSNQLMRLFTMLMKAGNFHGMIKLFDRAKNDTFLTSNMVKEKIMLAYNNMLRPLPAIKWAEIELSHGIKSSNLYTELGDAMISLSKMLDTDEQKRNAIKSAGNIYEKAFKKFKEYTPGIKASCAYLKIGDEEKAKKMAKLVYISTLKNNHDETTDYWCASARLQACCIAKNDAKTLNEALNHLLNLKCEKWYLESTIASISEINKTIKSPDIEKVLDKLGKKLDGSLTMDEQPKTQKDKFMQAIYSKSYSYRGLASSFEGSNSVGGNTRFGGQLPDHSVSRKDFEIFDKILETPIRELFPKGVAEKLYEGKNISLDSKISQIEDINEFMAITNKFIRYHFGTENFADTGFKLETNVENPNNPYNESVKSLLEVSGKKCDKSADTRTNISAIFAMGLGDCRHHAQVKQIMFDRWRDQKMSNVMDKMFEQGMTKDLLTEFYELSRTELRTIDVKIQMPIALEGPYTATKTRDNKFIYCEENKGKCYEEHTLNVLVTKDMSGELERVSLQDAFYQNAYDFENHDIDLTKDFKVNDNGEFSIKAGVMPGDRVDIGKDIPIIIEPTVYAGKRDKADEDEHGNGIKLIGMPMGLDSPEEFIAKLQNRGKTNEVLNHLRDGYIEYLNRQKEKEDEEGLTL